MNGILAGIAVVFLIFIIAQICAQIRLRRALRVLKGARRR